MVEDLRAPFRQQFDNARDPYTARNALGITSLGGGGGAPTTAEYITAATDPTLTNERVLTNTATITWDFTTPGQAKASTASGGGNVSNSGTPTLGQYAKWVTATTIQGVAPATVLSDIGAQPAGSYLTTAAAAAAYQPLDADLTAIAALAGTNTIYYRSAANTWAAVTISTGLSFSGGTLACTVSASDDVLEFANLAAFPITGVAGIIYVALDTNKIYRWSAAVAATTIWNSADKSAGVTLSGGNLTATASGGNQGVRATVGASTGKLYFEVSYTSSSGYFGLGLASMPFNATTNAAGVAPSSGWIQVNGASTINIGGLPSPIGIAVDLGAKRIWFRSAPSGNWNGNATYNPATSVGGVDISALSGSFFPMATALAASNDAIGNFGATAFSGAIPSGFSSWNNAGGAPAYVEISPSPDLSGYLTTAAAAAAYQPLDGDLTAIAALTGTNTIYYRSGTNTWSPVVVSTGLAFSGGNLTSTVISGAPVGAEYITSTSDATLTAERVLTDTATVTWDRATAGQIKANATGGGGSAVTIIVPPQKFTASGTYTPTSGMTYAIIECVGGGGGGGGANASASQIVSAGGGGSGAYSRRIVTAAMVGASQTVTVGTGGNGGTAAPGAGQAGNDTSVGTLCVAKGGAGAQAAAQGATVAGGLGGAGASGTGDITASGAPGGNGIYSADALAQGGAGVGGSSIFGGGGRSTGDFSVGVVGVAATNYGSGGSGASSYNLVGKAGGAGSAGFVIITEYK